MKIFSSAPGGPIDTVEVEKSDKLSEISKTLCALPYDSRIRVLRWGRTIGPGSTLDAKTTLPFLESLILLPGVKNVGQAAFLGHAHLNSVIFPSSIREIGKDAFNYCLNLESIHIPEDAPLSVIPEGFACYDPIAEFVCPKALKVIGTYAFFHCGRLKLFTLNEGLQEICPQAFNETALTHLHIPSTLQSYGFNKIPKLQGFSVEPGSRFREINGVLIDGDVLVSFPLGALEADTMRIPDGVRTLTPNFDEAVRGAKIIALPESIDAGRLFDGCTFHRLAGNARGIEVSPRHTELKTVDGVLFSKDMTKLLAFPGDKTSAAYVVPSTVKEVAPYAFYRARLDSLIFQDWVFVEQCAFHSVLISNVIFHGGIDTTPSRYVSLFVKSVINCLHFYGHLIGEAKIIDDKSNIKTVVVDDARILDDIKDAFSGGLPQPRFLCA